MELTLSPEEVRVLGCLIEKAVTTPEYYPLTLNSLVAACNQRSNRSPVVDYDEDQVNEALDGLREKGLVRRVDTAGGRAPKFRHLLPEVIPLDGAQIAVICVLLLRGAQTLGELRSRTDRLYAFRDLGHVEETVKSLTHPAEESGIDLPLVAPLPLRPGSREVRFVHLFGPVVQLHEEPNASSVSMAPALEPRATRSELEALRAEVAELRQAYEELQAEFKAFKSQF